jgi:hypothetical protein
MLEPPSQSDMCLPSPTQESNSGSFLSCSFEDDREQIRARELLARTVVEGFLNVLHRSPHLGASMDFAEHRAYMPGDDLRR